MNEPDPAPGLTPQEVKQRALSGVALVLGRGILILGLGLVGNTILARQLRPADFGLVAFGLALMGFATALSDGGLGAGLIRSSESLEPSKLRDVFGLQLALTLVFVFAVCSVGLSFFGNAGRLTALMSLALPLSAVYTPVQIVLERNLDYRILARVEVRQTAIYYTFAVVAVSLGMGVWGLASAVVARAVAGNALFMLERPRLFVVPSLSITRLRPLLRFGLNFQANSLAVIARDQGLNIGIAAIANTTTLGIWVLARRVLELPMLLFQSLWRVSFPAMSQLMASGENPKPVLERAVGLASVGSGLVLAPCAAASPALVPAIFGAPWHDSGAIVALSCAALVIAGPISVATAGFLYADGDAAAVLRATAVHAAAWLVVALSLLPWLGTISVGIGLVVGSTIDAVLLAVPTVRKTSARLAANAVLPISVALLATVVGVIVGILLGETPAAGVVAALAALGTWVAATVLVRRELVAHLFAVARRALFSTVAPGRV